MLNTKSSLTASTPYYHVSQNIFSAYSRNSAPSDSFYLPSEAPNFSTVPTFLPFAPRSEGHSFPALVGDASTDAWRSLPAGPAAACWPYDPLHNFHYTPSYGGLDVRRKNATRESTSTLKAWLYEHIKNPYPTKGEKIMLAIITKMTLTQVSTWFANARRRLKKENKMQWSPRNRTGDDDDDDDDDDKNSDIDDVISSNNRRDDDELSRRRGDDDELSRRRNTDVDDDDDDEIIVDSDQPAFIPFPMNIASSYLQNNSSLSDPFKPKKPDNTRLSPHAISPSIAPLKTPNEKPRIWSLADVATSGVESKESGGETQPAIIKSTLQALKDEDHLRRLHESRTTRLDHPLLSDEDHLRRSRESRTTRLDQPHRTSTPDSQKGFYPASNPLHKLHGLSGSQLAHLQSLYRSHVVRPVLCRKEDGEKRMSPGQEGPVVDSTSNINFDTRPLFKNGANIISSQIR